MLSPTYLITFRKLTIAIGLSLSSMPTVVAQITTITPTIPEYKVLLKRGITKAESGDYKSAIDDFDTAIQLNPQYVEAYYHRGMVRSATPWISSKTTPAEDFETARKINSGFGPAWIELGRIKEDLSYLDTAIKLNPEDARAYYCRGYVRAKHASTYLGQINSGRKPRISDELFIALKAQSVQLDELTLYLRNSLRNSIEDYEKAISINPRYAEAYLGSARAHVKLKEYQPAIDDFTRVIQLFPQKVEAYQERGLARFESGDESGALDDFRQVIRLAKTRAAITAPSSEIDIFQRQGRYVSQLGKFKESLTLAKAYYEEGLAYWHVGEDPELALESLTRAIQLNLKIADVFYQRGLLYLELRKVPEAIGDLTQAIQLRSGDADYHYSRGRALFQAGDYAKAASDFTESIWLSPRFSDAYYWRGRANYNLGNKLQALADFSVAIKKDPSSTPAYYWRGIVLEDAGRILLANVDYLKVVENRPLANDDDPVTLEWKRSSRQVHYNRGRARVALAGVPGLDEDYNREEAETYLKQAVQDFSAVIAANSNVPEAYFWRARAEKWSRHSDVSMKDLNAAISMRPEFVNAYLERSYLSYGAQGLNDLNEVIRLKPTWARGYYERAQRSLYGISTNFDIKSVLADLTKAIELDPTFVEAYKTRAGLRHERNDDLKGVLEDLTQVIRLNPDDVDAHMERARIYSVLKDYQGVIEDATRTIELASGARWSSGNGLARMYLMRSRARYETGDGIGSYEDDQRGRELLVSCSSCSLSSNLAQAKKADALLQKGLSLSLRGDTTGARLNFEEAAKLYHAAGKMSQYQNAKFQLSKL